MPLATNPNFDDFHRLCETCGYDLIGLDAGSHCPECGRPVEASLPAHRVGSAWQRKPGLWSWLVTNYRTLRAPRDAFSAIALPRKGGKWLAIFNSIVAATIMVAPWTGTIIGDPVRSARGSGPLPELLTFTWVFPAQVAAIAMILLIMTYIEYLGVRFIAARRGWRLTRAGAWQVCSHATVGWIILGLAPLLAMAALYIMRVVLQWPLGTVLDGRRFGLGQTSVGNLLMWILPVVSILAGVFCYELLVHVGVRRCRFAATRCD